ncbi:MAG TPA: hypothetical protein VFC19_50045 [Candidatus Limnocylindrales bacterium]|nr:hypothetical protein [Candidatus Limnocylindrales bacterium]
MSIIQVDFRDIASHIGLPKVAAAPFPLEYVSDEEQHITVERTGPAYRRWAQAHRADPGPQSVIIEQPPASASVTAALDCAHAVVQVFGAAGTSDPENVRLFRTA